MGSLTSTEEKVARSDWSEFSCRGHSRLMQLRVRRTRTAWYCISPECRQENNSPVTTRMGPPSFRTTGASPADSR